MSWKPRGSPPSLRRRGWMTMHPKSFRLFSQDALVGRKGPTPKSLQPDVLRLVATKPGTLEHKSGWDIREGRGT